MTVSQAARSSYDPMPPLEEGLVPEQVVVGSAWPSLRRVALGTALAVPLAWLCFSGVQQVSSNWGAALQLNLQPSCLKDEELFAGICYMKCSLLTGGHAPHRVANAACCKTDNDFFCTLISNLQANFAWPSSGGWGRHPQLPPRARCRWCLWA